MQKDTRKRFAQGGTPPVRGVGSQPVPPGGHFRRETEFAADRVPGTFSAVLCGHESGSVSAQLLPCARSCGERCSWWSRGVCGVVSRPRHAGAQRHRLPAPTRAQPTTGRPAAGRRERKGAHASRSRSRPGAAARARPPAFRGRSAPKKPAFRRASGSRHCPVHARLS